MEMVYMKIRRPEFGRYFIWMSLLFGALSFKLAELRSSPHPAAFLLDLQRDWLKHLKAVFILQDIILNNENNEENKKKIKYLQYLHHGMVCSSSNMLRWF